MTIDLVPRGDRDAAAAVDAALRAARVDAEPRAEQYASRWRAASLREGVSREPPARSTRPAATSAASDDG